MRAVVLESFGANLIEKEMSAPAVGTGEVLVDVFAAPVLPYMAEVLNGARQYVLPLPVIPGAGAIVKERAVEPDSTRLKPGDWVYCDPTIRARDGATSPDITLQALSARGEGGQKLQQYFRDGSFAEQIRTPTENALLIGSIDSADAGKWCALGALLVAYGGLSAIQFRPGELLLASGAAGNFGSATVALALAMGAQAVIAPGRNVATLTDLVARFGQRVIAVPLTGNPGVDTDLMKSAAAPGPIDVVQDFLPPTVPASVVRAALLTLRQGGRAVLTGGVGMLGGGDLALPYPWIMRNAISIRGQWVYSLDLAQTMLSLIYSGLLDLGHWSVSGFTLSQANEAVAHAASSSGPFKLTVLTPHL